MAISGFVRIFLDLMISLGAGVGTAFLLSMYGVYSGLLDINTPQTGNESSLDNFWITGPSLVIWLIAFLWLRYRKAS